MQIVKDSDERERKKILRKVSDYALHTTENEKKTGTLNSLDVQKVGFHRMRRP